MVEQIGVLSEVRCDPKVAMWRLLLRLIWHFIDCNIMSIRECLQRQKN
jgi:hypothetical protein